MDWISEDLVLPSALLFSGLTPSLCQVKSLSLFESLLLYFKVKGLEWIFSTFPDINIL